MNKKDSQIRKTLAITEKQFESQVKDLAKIFGWRYYHTWRSIHSPAGFPDVIMVRPPRLIFAELKSDKGKPSPAQEAWLNDLKGCPTVEVYLWRPVDFEAVMEILR